MNRPTSSQPRRRAQRGLTLVEMLVAMVILGFVMTLVSEVVFQVSQVARAADAATRGTAARWGSGWSASGLIANLLAPPEIGDDPPFTGSNQQITGFTSQPLDGSDRGIERFELELRGSGDGSRNTELQALASRPGRISREAAVVAVFPGRAEFRFVDQAGQAQLVWPAPTRSEQDDEALPQAVIVRDADSGKTLMWYGFQGEPSKPEPAVSLFNIAKP